MDELNIKKAIAQNSRIKNSGSTFKNPVNQTDKKVWQLIKSSVPKGTSFGDAFISEKHANFFVNKNAKSADMMSLIKFVKKKFDSTGIKLELEIVVVK